MQRHTTIPIPASGGKQRRLLVQRVLDSRLSLLLLLLLAVCTQIYVIKVGGVHWGSDEAVVAIMAKDILQRGAHPVFYYGATYAGTLEPHWIALCFAILGVSVQAYRIAVMLLLIFLIYMVYSIGSFVFGRRTAFLAAMYLALPPYYFLFKGLTSDGAYDSVTILGAVVLYASLRIEAEIRAGRASSLWFAILGLSAGLGWWVDPLIGVFYLSVGVWFFLVNPKVLRAPLARYGLSALMFGLGSLPWWISNIRHSWHSVTTPELASTSASLAVDQIYKFFTRGLPVLLGSRPVFRTQESYPFETLGSIFLYLIPVIIAGRFAWEARTSIRNDPTNQGSKPRGILLLLLVAVLLPVAASTNARSTITMSMGEPRYLFPLFAVFAVLLVFGISQLSIRGPLARSVALVLLAFVVFSNSSGIVRHDQYLAFFSRTHIGSLSDVIEQLKLRGIKSVFASYWVAYRISFESNERIIATPFGAYPTRVYRYREAVLRDSRPAFVLYGSEAEDFQRYLQSTGTEWQSFRLEPFVVFHDIDPRIIEVLHQKLTIPVSSSLVVPVHIQDHVDPAQAAAVHGQLAVRPEGNDCAVGAGLPSSEINVGCQ